MPFQVELLIFCLLGRFYEVRVWSATVWICPFSYNNISEVRGTEVLRFIPKVFSGFEVMALRRSLEFLHSNFGKFVHGAHVVLEFH